MRLTLTTLAATVLAAAATAQGPLFPTNRVIGWADLPAPATTGYLDIQDIDNNCQRAVTVCRTKLPVRAPVPYGGGTAYDSRYRSVWVSDGQVLAEYLVRGCQARCRPFKAVLSNPRAFVSGLAIADAKPRLFQLATTPGYMEIVTYDNSACPKAASKCVFTIGPRDVAAGIAYDEVNDNVFWSLSTPLTSGGFSNTLFVAPASSPCRPFCKIPIMQNCSRQLVTGLAYDSCKKMLYATDGQVTQSIEVVDARMCRLRQLSCCKKQINPVWRGIAVVPGWRKANVSRSCTRRPCASCPNMQLACSGGDPALGSNTFGFDVSGAPSGSIGLMVVGPGPCTTGLPFGCGRLYPSLAGVIIYPASILTGTGSCGGSGNWSFPIPANQNLCGRQMCAQLVMFCPSGGAFGVGLTNAFSFSITGG